MNVTDATGAKTAAASRAACLVPALLVAAAYAPLAPWLWARWREPGGFFTHGPLVPLAAAWIVWSRRGDLRARVDSGDWRGLLLLLPALALFGTATALRFDSPALASLLLLLPGLVWLLLGTRTLAALAFPLAFLAFAVPWPMELLADVVQSLKLFVVAASSALVNLFGAGVAAEGSFLVLPGGDRLLVDDECSGLRSALALVALGAFIAGTARELSVARRLLLFALSLPIALAANVLRVALLATVGRISGAGTARAWHDPSTWGVYAVAIAACVLLERALRPKASRR